MKRVFDVTVRTENTYRITIDDQVMNEEFLKEFTADFYDIDSIEGHAKNLAEMTACELHVGSFYEGYGWVKIYGEYSECLSADAVESGADVTEVVERSIESEVKEITPGADTTQQREGNDGDQK